MRKETIINPDIDRGFASFENRMVPEFSHLDVERGDALKTSDNPVIKRLLADRLEVCEVVETFYMGLRAPTGRIERHFAAKITHEFEIALATDGFLRFKFNSPDQVHLSLFNIFPDRRGRGLARVHFPAVIDGLFRAGVVIVYGEVASPYPEPPKSLNVNKLIRFYVRDAGFAHLGGRSIVKVSPYPRASDDSAQAPSKKRAIGTLKQSEMAMIS